MIRRMGYGEEEVGAQGVRHGSGGKAEDAVKRKKENVGEQEKGNFSKG